ncbi:MAG TPA: sarcosine oxidase subunit delta [Actinomycetota bacterium]|nr:sarcosine oxidase subunit delta [Actinomycetota bacterium]
MILIPCPNCGPRNVSEFRYVGESIARPDPNSATQEQWRAYLYEKSNPAGWMTESWFHRAGCGRFLKVERDTISNEVRAVKLEEAAAGKGGN